MIETNQPSLILLCLALHNQDLWFDVSDCYVKLVNNDDPLSDDEEVFYSVLGRTSHDYIGLGIINCEWLLTEEVQTRFVEDNGACVEVDVLKDDMGFFYEINLYHVRTGDEEEVFLRN